MRILVAGGSGILGRTMVPMLVADGHQVTATTRRAERAGEIAALGAEVAVTDVFDRAGLETAVAEARPDAIVHQLTDLTGGDLASNARLREVGTRNLVDAAMAAGVTRMVAQSICWALSPSTTPLEESAPLDTQAGEPRRTTVLGVQALESAVGELDGGIVLRYGHLYGPSTMWASDGRFADLVRAGQLPLADAVLPFVHLQDAARAAVDALDWPSGVYHVTDDEPAALTDWVPVYAAAVGADVPPVPEPSGPGWPIANDRVHARGLTFAYPSWRDGFQTLQRDDG